MVIENGNSNNGHEEGGIALLEDATERPADEQRENVATAKTIDIPKGSGAVDSKLALRIETRINVMLTLLAQLRKGEDAEYIADAAKRECEAVLDTVRGKSS